MGGEECGLRNPGGSGIHVPQAPLSSCSKMTGGEDGEARSGGACPIPSGTSGWLEGRLPAALLAYLVLLPGATTILSFQAPMGLSWLRPHSYLNEWLEMGMLGRQVQAQLGAKEWHGGFRNGEVASGSSSQTPCPRKACTALAGKGGW